MTDDRDYTYDELLQRVFAIMRDKNPEMVAGEKKKFVMRPPQVVRVGTKKTAFVNFTEIAKMWVKKHLVLNWRDNFGTLLKSNNTRTTLLLWDPKSNVFCWHVVIVRRSFLLCYKGSKWDLKIVTVGTDSEIVLTSGLTAVYVIIWVSVHCLTSERNISGCIVSPSTCWLSFSPSWEPWAPLTATASWWWRAGSNRSTSRTSWDDTSRSTSPVTPAGKKVCSAYNGTYLLLT